MTRPLALRGARVFDGTGLHADRALLLEGGRVAGIVPGDALPASALCHDLPGGVLAPGFVDLQVNGGGGVMLGEAPTPATLARMAETHARLGATAILPTLITDTPDTTEAAVAAVAQAVAAGVPGIAGLHLEGPHLAPGRGGAHDAALIRPMTGADLAFLCEAAARLPALMVTLAPEAATPGQIARLARAGAVVSLGHTDAGYEACQEAARAGASCVTHLFNAMRQLGSREPGTVGAALALGALDAGLIADGLHVHPASLGAALRAKRGPGQLFLVSDAMAVAGTARDHFALNGRRIERRDGRLTLPDGTLAGADLDLARAVRLLVEETGTDLATALAMATSVPARVIGKGGCLGRLAAGGPADVVWLTEALRLGGVWRAGVPIAAPDPSLAASQSAGFGG